MTENIKRLHFNNGEPNIAEMSEILLKKDFRTLTEANDETLPAGTVAMLYNPCNNTMFAILVVKHTSLGLIYLLFNNMAKGQEFGNFLCTKQNFKNLYYKPLFQVPMKDSKPQLENLSQILSKAGFCSLVDATPDNLPEGCIALLYSHSIVIIPSIVRVLSKGNNRFLYLRQGNVAGSWQSSVIMDHLSPFEKFSYLVIS